MDRQAELRSKAGIQSRAEQRARANQQAAAARGGAAEGAGRTVLVVEDSVISRKVINNTLSPRGYRITEAADGFQALAQLTNEKPDLVLLDLILPGMDGYKVLSHMKKKPEFESIPVIILTSRDTLFDKLKGKMSGSDEYLTKPFSSVELVDKVSKYIK
jgi:twitching motility two-component system response regulator PilG